MPAILGLDEVRLVETTHVPAFTDDIPTLTFNICGERWKLKIYTGTLFVNGEKFETFFSGSDNTVVMTEDTFNTVNIRDTLASLRRWIRQTSE